MPIEIPEGEPSGQRERRKSTQQETAFLTQTPAWDRLRDSITAGVFGGALDRYPGPGRGIVTAPLPMPDVPYNDAPDRTAQATQELAEHAAETAELTRQLSAAMIESLALSKQAREDALESAAATRRQAVHSMVIGYSSLGLAVASTVVALIALLG